MTGGLEVCILERVRPEAVGELVVPPRGVREELWHALRGIQAPDKGLELRRVKHPGGTGTKSDGSGEPYGDDPRQRAGARTPLPPKS